MMKKAENLSFFCVNRKIIVILVYYNHSFGGFWG